jgi:hypothetical protein
LLEQFCSVSCVCHKQVGKIKPTIVLIEPMAISTKGWKNIS